MIRKVILSILKSINRKVNAPDWKNLRTLTPISDVFGYDRGNQSVHRYYIDQFIKERSENINGKTLEVGELMYTSRFVKNISEAKFLSYVDSADGNSIHGDLTKIETLPKEAFDCFVCTQTFNFIYDFHSAIHGAHHVLKRGGVLLATVSGIQQISTYDATRWGDYWRFTEQSCRRAFEDAFGKDNVEVITFGNVLASIAALQGLSAGEITEHELNHRDSAYPLIIGILARK